MTRQTWTAAVAAFVFVVLAAVIAMVPVPFVTWSPGPTYDLLGSVDGEPTVTVQGVQTQPSSGQLRMATVNVTGPDSVITLPEALFAYWLPDNEVLPRQAVYRPGLDINQVKEAEAASMESSQSLAKVAALRAAGIKVTELPMVQKVSASGPSAGRLQPGDLITAIDNQPVSGVEQAGAMIREGNVGRVLKIDLLRQGAVLTESVTTRALSDQPTVPDAGIELAIGYLFDPEVTVALDPSIGGSSAGLMFALAIYDKLSSEDLVAGRVIAGTGAIDATGRISAIGGVREKASAAHRDGATVFLLPKANCTDLGTPPEGLRAVPVETLGDALSAMESLKLESTAAEVPSC